MDFSSLGFIDRERAEFMELLGFLFVQPPSGFFIVYDSFDENGTGVSFESDSLRGALDGGWQAVEDRADALRRGGQHG